MQRLLSLLFIALLAPAAQAAETFETSAGNYGWGLPVQASTFAPTIDFGLYLVHAAMILIFVLWSIFFTYLLIRYRAKPGVPAVRDEHEPGEAAAMATGSGAKAPAATLALEHATLLKSLAPDLIVMAFEIALIFLYAIPSWSKVKIDMPDPKDSNVIEVVAQQFAWNVRYPGPDGKFGKSDLKLINFSNPVGLDRTDKDAADDIVAANEIHVPTGKNTLLWLTSMDVIHSFFVPEFRVKQDAMPGMRIPVWFEPTKVGTYEIGCAQLCGFGHSLMRGTVIVQTPEDFAAWLASQNQAAASKTQTAAPTQAW